MTIYTHGYVPVNITSARIVQVWIEQQHGRIKWHYKEKKPTRLTKSIDKTPIIHFKATYAENDKGCPVGQPACDGRGDDAQRAQGHRWL